MKEKRDTRIRVETPCFFWPNVVLTLTAVVVLLVGVVVVMVSCV